jgi:hypothetical protein
MTNKLMKALKEIEEANDTADGWWYDTSVYIETIFNLRTITVNGDVPFNNAEKLLDALRLKLKGPVGFNTRIELLKGGEKIPTELLDVIECCEMSD